MALVSMGRSVLLQELSLLRGILLFLVFRFARRVVCSRIVLAGRFLRVVRVLLVVRLSWSCDWVMWFYKCDFVLWMTQPQAFFECVFSWFVSPVLFVG